MDLSFSTKADNTSIKTSSKRKGTSSPVREKKVRRLTPPEELEVPLSPEDITTTGESGKL